MASLISTEVIRTYTVLCPHHFGHRLHTGTAMCNVIIRTNARDEITDLTIYCEVADQEGRQDRT